MSLERMIKGLDIALAETRPDPQDRYQLAMSRRAQAILDRANRLPNPEDMLAHSAKDLADQIRRRTGEPVHAPDLLPYVRAKLAISNPDYA